jgi:hypothetical protein
LAGEAGDPAGAAQALEQLLVDYLWCFDPNTTFAAWGARVLLDVFRSKVGDAASAEAALAFAKLVSHWEQTLGADHPHTLASERALAYWRDQAGPESTDAP